MLKLAKWYGVFLLALPCIAQAYTVEITSTSRGTMQPNDAFLALLGLTPPAGDGVMPYTLTIGSSVDTAAPSYSEAEYGEIVQSDPTPVEVDFTFGGQTFHYAGQGGTFLSAKQYGYTQRVYFVLPQSPSIEFFTWHFIDTSGSPLSPNPFDNVGPQETILDGGLYAKLDQNNPGATVGMGATVTSFSIHAVSPVPEPAPAGMLAGGLALLIWRAARHSGGRIRTLSSMRNSWPRC